MKRQWKIKRRIAAVAVILLIVGALIGCPSQKKQGLPVRVQVDD